jgi:hypothetical protein
MTIKYFSSKQINITKSYLAKRFLYFTINFTHLFLMLLQIKNDAAVNKIVINFPKNFDGRKQTKT